MSPTLLRGTLPRLHSYPTSILGNECVVLQAAVQCPEAAPDPRGISFIDLTYDELAPAHDEDRSSCAVTEPPILLVIQRCLRLRSRDRPCRSVF